MTGPWVPDELLKLWSKRTAKIDAEAGPKIAEYEKLLGRALTGAERVGVVKTAVLKTRVRKQHAELSALHASWTSEAARAGWTPDRLRRAVRLRTPPGRARQEPRVLPADLTSETRIARPGGPVPPDIDWSGPQATAGVLPVAGGVLPVAGGVLPVAGRFEPGKVAEAGVASAALQGAGTRRAVFSRADVAGQVAAHLPPAGLSAAEVVARVEQLTDLALDLDDAVPVGLQTVGVTARASDARYATVQVLNAEARVLDLAARGRRGGYGRLPLTALMPLGRDGGLDPSQYRAVLQLAAGGDFLSVLTAPAGAGKTSTLGAAARAWQQAGYRVVGLAPSARAAAELATATGETTDTLAKWLHSHHNTPPGAQATSALDGRTVVILDEASMASTLDLDPLITAAAQVGAKVVLVGDPAQIGVVNGPGGMLTALASAGHGVELAEIHRFSQAWEREASLALRTGEPGALAAYHTAGRLHPCQDGDAALDRAFAHWAEARTDGQDALMLARTRVDVDALNQRARASALEAGQITGLVTVAGGRDWQAGDVLRARRNNRRLVVGDGHVRNGDRYQVLGPGPQDGLIVQDLTGRGRTVLPAAYVAEHAEYGWASTIDAAQGATTDVGIVLVRPGMDREHLYVAMTRGRNGNHAYVTPDPSTDDDHHGHPRHAPPAQADPEEQAGRVLEAALARSGAQDAAHTALEHARAQAAHTAREQQRVVERAAAREAVAAQLQRRQARPLPAEHTQALQQLTALRAEREQLRNDRDTIHHALSQTQAELEALPRWARGRRSALTDTIRTIQQQLRQTEPTRPSRDAEIDRLTRQVAHHTRQRQASDLTAPHRARPDRWDPTRSGALAWPRPAPVGGHDLSTIGLPQGRGPYRGPERHVATA